MKRIKLIFVFTVLIFTTVFGQEKKVICDCPKTPFAGTKADTTFHLSNGRTIVLCGYKNPESKPNTYSEFVLVACGQDTIIDFWGAVLTCRLKTNNDTLLVDQLENLPTGENLKYQETIWTTEKIYFTQAFFYPYFYVSKFFLCCQYPTIFCKAYTKQRLFLIFYNIIFCVVCTKNTLKAFSLQGVFI